ncbi:hypothetical protein [Mobilicoccus pelagius]|uniref:CobQ/CobB/MinD/ParA nucleotide binding domain-containing protein n=1 Tax=Mobilicoccus pelagius NBRC 104925 TaxID=1089455 RepID=H5UNW2_9MICO|nr:hypothetical protein [Mobilicoccus pelagius]GAB47420.1 hypothetical protein MOPEL_011_00020 [Mobilicoccus pelagius NBRC 104925]
MSRVISVVGTAGGVGSSVLAAALAMRASHLGAAVVAVDGRPYGGGLDVVLGADELPGIRWRDLADAVGPLDGVELFGRLPLVERCGVLSFDREMPLVPGGEVLAAVVAALRDVSDVVVVDAPRAGECWEGELASLSDEVVALTGTSVTALASAAASVAHLDAVHDVLWLACRTDRGAAADLDQRVPDLLDVPLLGAVPTDPKVAMCLSEGRPPPDKGPLVRAVDAMLGRLRPVQSPPPPAPRSGARRYGRAS